SLDRVEKALPKADQRVSVRYVLERGRVLSLSGKPREAQPRLREAFNLALMLKMDLHAIDAARMMAVAEPEKALEWNMKALDLAEKSADAGANKAKGPSTVASVGTTSRGKSTRKRCSCSRRHCNIPISSVIRLRSERRNGLLLRFSES